MGNKSQDSHCSRTFKISGHPKPHAAATNSLPYSTQSPTFGYKCTPRTDGQTGSPMEKLGMLARMPYTDGFQWPLLQVLSLLSLYYIFTYENSLSVCEGGTRCWHYNEEASKEGSHKYSVTAQQKLE